jgi:hypothetical protein
MTILLGRLLYTICFVIAVYVLLDWAQDVWK